MTAITDLLEKFPQQRILVLGDVMLDEFVWGRVNRISPEAPIPVVDVQRVTYVPGGSANVAANVASLGGKAVLFGVVGQDDAADKLAAELARCGIEAHLCTDQGRSTTIKTRIVAHNQQVVRVDRESRAPIGDGVSQALFGWLRAEMGQANALIISDYAKGVLQRPFLQKVIGHAISHRLPILVDPKGLDYGKYKGTTIITPNEAEALQAGFNHFGREASLEETAYYLLAKMACQAVLITRGDKGMSLFETNGQVSHLPTYAREVYDVTGAGDTVVSALALALVAGASLSQAANVANHAAGAVVGKVGTATVTREELQKAILAAFQ